MFMTTFKRGDIVLTYYPHSNQTKAKKRPALIVQADNLETGLSQVMAAMITTNMSRAGHKSRVVVLLLFPENQQTGLKSDSVIMTDNLATIDLDFMEKTLGKMPTMRDVDRALAATFGITHI